MSGPPEKRSRDASAPGAQASSRSSSFAGSEARHLTEAGELVVLPELPQIELLGHPIHRIDEAECVAYVDAALDAHAGGWIVTPNLDHLRRLSEDAEFRSICAQASLSVADGMPLVWASRLAGTPLPERVAGSNLIQSVSAMLAKKRRSAFFLGGDPGTAEAAAEILADRHRGLQIAGTDCPEVGFERDGARMDELRNRLLASAPDVVFVALGSPKQERVIAELRTLLPGTWWLGIGISFSFVCGAVQRAPLWVQRLGLEWLHRLIQEPRRLARRYLVDGLPFAVRLLLGALRQRLGGGFQP